MRSNRAGDSAGIDGGLVLSQAALERLAVAVLHKNGLATRGKVAERMRRALRHLGIPTAISQATPRLYSGKRRQLWIDGPGAVTKIRNELVHPASRLGAKPGSYFFEAWQLAQWYVEMMLLRMAGYDGFYSNRLRARWIGQVEPVPWARKGKR